MDRMHIHKVDVRQDRLQHPLQRQFRRRAEEADQVRQAADHPGEQVPGIQPTMLVLLLWNRLKRATLARLTTVMRMSMVAIS